MSKFSYTLNELNQACRFLLDKTDSKVLLFQGEMGAGKTTLIKALVRMLGSKDTVSSPTFSLVNEYMGTNGPIYHFDLYRIEDEEEAYGIGLEEYLDSGNWCLVEWPDKASSILPDKTTLIDIKIHLNGKRELTIY